MIYLDHNATTNIHPAAFEAAKQLLAKPYNASSIHQWGRIARQDLEQARLAVLKLVLEASQLNSYRVIFTASATEANNWILHNYLDGEVFISAIEHSSIMYYQAYKNCQIIQVTSEGVIDLADLQQKLAVSKADKKLVSVMLANNETGIMQPMAQISEIAKNYGAKIHSDVVQVVGKLPLDIAKMKVDAVSISGHKFGALTGIGALIVAKNIPLKPFIQGGGQEQNLRAGTENLAGAISMGAVAKIVQQELAKRRQHMQMLQQHLEKQLANYEDIIIVGADCCRLPNTTLLINRRKSAQLQLIALDLKNIAVSSGAACSSGKVGQSHVLKAMGYNEAQINNAIRISTSYNNTIEDIDNFVKIYHEVNL